MKVQNNLILATYLAGIYDVNRNETMQRDDVSIIAAWAESIIRIGLQGVVFHNSLSETSIAKYASHIKFIKVDFNEKYNTNNFRYFLYNDYLKKNIVDNIFITDITDVVVLNNPFTNDFFINNTDKIFCGDEPKLLDNEWMQSHSAHLRSKINDFAEYEQKFKNETLLNCGVIGGSITIMQPFLEKLCTIHEKYSINNTTSYTGDMGAFNYLLRTQFNTEIIHGSPVNTIFKLYENQRKDCWFMHK